MDLIDREQLMNYIRSRKINIGKLAHGVIMKQPSIQPQEPCEDAISRKEVLNQIFYSTDNNGDVVLGSVLRHRIENLKSVKPQESKWTPISERLPKERGWYLAVFKEKDTGYQLIPRVVDYISKNNWRIIDDEAYVKNYRDILECVAWMPLPEPYKAESEET